MEERMGCRFRVVGLALIATLVAIWCKISERTQRDAEILVGGCGRRSGLDFAFLAGRLYRQQNGNTLSLRDPRH
jgi:hypothetical protein